MAGVQMTPTYRRALAEFRAAGIDILVIPGPGQVTGSAFARPADPGDAPQRLRLYVTIRGSTFSGLWLFVLLHEVAHHSMGHTTVRTTVPVWQQEYDADQEALRLLAGWQPAALPRCEAASKQHIRPRLQQMIDAEIWNHVDGDIARWAGCTLPPGWDEYEAGLAVMRLSRLGHIPEEIPF